MSSLQSYSLWVTLYSRNPKEEWGLEVKGGWEGKSGSWLQVSRIRPGKTKNENKILFLIFFFSGSPADFAGKEMYKCR